MKNFVILLITLLGAILHVNATSYKFTIQIDGDSLKDLKTKQMKLYAFKGVTDPNSLPIVWFSADNYLSNTVISWTDDYKAYISLQDSTAGAYINSMTVADMKGGFTAEVDKAGYGLLTSKSYPDSDPTKYYILNHSSEPFSAGLMQFNGKNEAPITSTTLNGNSMLTLVPSQTILVMFSSQDLSIGTVVEQTATDSAAMKVDMSKTTTVSISYNMNGGFTCGNAAICQPIEPQHNMADGIFGDGKDSSRGAML